MRIHHIWRYYSYSYSFWPSLSHKDCMRRNKNLILMNRKPIYIYIGMYLEHYGFRYIQTDYPSKFHLLIRVISYSV